MVVFLQTPVWPMKTTPSFFAFYVLLDLNLGTIKDAASNNATLTLPSVGTLAAAHANASRATKTATPCAAVR